MKGRGLSSIHHSSFRIHHSVFMPPAKKGVGLREVRVGLMVVVAIGVLIFLILNASGDISPFTTKLHLKARFQNADGLRPGSEVRLAGVTIGKVDDVRLLPPSTNPDEPQVEATFSIKSVIDGKPANDLIRDDSKALLGSPSLLGSDKVINLTPGTQLGQKGKDGRFVNDEAFYNNLNATVRSVDELTRQIQSGQGTAGKLVNDPELYNNLNQVSLSLHHIFEDLRAGRGTAGKLLTDEAMYNDARAAIARFNTTTERLDSVVAGVQR